MKIYSWNFMILLNIIGSVIILSSSSFVSFWIGMELTSMTLPPLISSFNSSLLSKVNSWKYYMIQCYSSSVFLLALLCLSLSSVSLIQSNMSWLIIFSSMIVKMGILPFQGWLFHVSSSISWINFLILSTIQKIGPLIMVSESTMLLSSSLSIELIISSFFSLISIIGILTNSVRYIMVISSVINSMWMIAASQISKSSFFSFMVFYFLHLFILFLFLKKESSNVMDELFFFNKKNFSVELAKTLCVFSMIGMPPLLGFFVKMMVIDQMIEQQQIFSVFILTLISSMIMLMYVKLLILNSMNMKVQFNQFKSNSFISISSTLFFLSLFFFFS